MLQSNKKTCQSKPILDSNDAVVYLSELVNSTQSAKVVVELAMLPQLPAFIEADKTDYTTEEIETGCNSKPAT